MSYVLAYTGTTLFVYLSVGLSVAIVGVIIWLVESGVLHNLGHHDDIEDDGKNAAYSS